jgi:hypothetical protein
MLNIVQIEEIEHLLLQMPGLVEQQEQRSINFEQNASAWLKSVEGKFTANRLYQAGYIATLRSSLIAAEQGLIPAGFEFRNRPGRSKLLHAVASQALQHAAEVASNLITENRVRISEAERTAQQIVAAAFSRGLIPVRDEGMTNTQYLQMLRRSFATVSDLENAFAHLEGLVGPNDALILFDRALAPYFPAH